MFRLAFLKYLSENVAILQIYYLAEPVSARYLSDFRFVAVYVPSQFTSIANDHVFTIGLFFTLLASDVFYTLRPVDTLFKVDKVKHECRWRP